MTNHEAISVLESINAKTDYFLINDDARAEAIDMAISALQEQDLQQNCNQLATDLISRQAAIDAINNIMPTKEGLYEPSEVLCELMQLPSVQPELEHTMEEFMYGQDLGSPEDGSL